MEIQSIEIHMLKVRPAKTTPPPASRSLSTKCLNNNLFPAGITNFGSRFLPPTCETTGNELDPRGRVCGLRMPKRHDASRIVFRTRFQRIAKTAGKAVNGKSTLDTWEGFAGPCHSPSNNTPMGQKDRMGLPFFRIWTPKMGFGVPLGFPLNHQRRGHRQKTRGKPIFAPSWPLSVWGVPFSARLVHLGNQGDRLKPHLNIGHLFET